MVVLDLEDRKEARLHAYLAQIALEVCRGRMKNPAEATLDHFIMKWKDEVEAPPKEDMDTKKAMIAMLVRPK